MSNPKSAANAWAKMKPKLFSDATTAKTTTPRKPKSKNPNAESGVAPTAEANGEVDGAPKKTPSPRKRKPAANMEDGGSPKKKGRKPKKDVETETSGCFRSFISQPTPKLTSHLAPTNDDAVTDASEATTLVKSEEAAEEEVA